MVSGLPFRAESLGFGVGLPQCCTCCTTLGGLGMRVDC